MSLSNENVRTKLSLSWLQMRFNRVKSKRSFDDGFCCEFSLRSLTWITTRYFLGKDWLHVRNRIIQQWCSLFKTYAWCINQWRIHVLSVFNKWIFGGFFDGFKVWSIFHLIQGCVGVRFNILVPRQSRCIPDLVLWNFETKNQFDREKFKRNCWKENRRLHRQVFKIIL